MSATFLVGFQLSIIIFYFSEVSVFTFLTDIKLASWKKLFLISACIFINQIPFLAPLIIDPIFFWLILIIRKHKPLSLRTLYLALAPSVFVDLISRFLEFCLIPYLLQLNASISSHLMTSIFAYLLIFPCLKIMSYLIGKDYKKLYEKENSERSKRFTTIMLFFIAAYYIDVFFILGFEDPFLYYLKPVAIPRSYQILYLSFTAFFLMLLAYFNRQSKIKLENELKIEKETYIENLINYGNNLEKLYEEVGQFKKTYYQKLEDLGSALEEKDMAKIRQVYQSTVGEAKEYWDDKHYNISKLSKLGMPSIKSLLSAKIIKAEKEGLAVHLELPDTINDTYMSRFDLLLLLSIFCDNAIDAAILSKEKTLSFAYFLDQDNQIISISKATTERQLDINRIFKDGYSTKGRGRGVGLANVLNIIQKYPNVSLSTKSKDYQFQQTLIIHKDKED